MGRPLALAAVLLALSGAVALAQSSPPITVKVYPKVTPNVAGTPARPQGVHLDVRIKIGIPADYNPPLVNEIDVWFPRGGLFNGDKYPTCSVRTMDVSGPSGCTKDSIMGYGGGTARADTTFTYPQITVVNGGQHVVYFYTVLNNPARVQEPVPGIITKLRGRWAYKLHVVIPRNLQIVAGVPIVLQTLHIAAGRGDWLSTIWCPRSREWDWQALAIFSNGQTIPTHGAVACRP
jgi:hypothetical protein